MTPGIYKRLLAVFFLFNSQAYGDEPRILIAYPAPETSNLSAYAQVIEGLEKKVGHSERLEVPAGSVDVQALLDRVHPDKVIVLGKAVADIISTSSYRERMLVALSYFQASEHSGITLALDSGTLTAQLSRLVPFIKRVFVVQESGHQTIAITSAGSGSLPTLIMREGNDTIETTRLVGRLLLDEATTTDAVFVPANLPNDMFYKIAELAWDKKIMLLSTNFYHLENGSLLVFSPDMAALGEQLGQMVTKKNPSYERVKTVNVALNRRVAQHLNIEFDAATLDLFTVKIK